MKGVDAIMTIYLIMLLIGNFIVWPIIFWIGLCKIRDEAWCVGYLQGTRHGRIEIFNKLVGNTEKEE